ncbi:MAG TPA: hypothetical protein VK974_05795 [Methylophilaceae bacterium]|nr:hypothetical protein [Methylophilaceae bacterium]
MDKIFYLLLALILFGPVTIGFASGDMEIQNLDWPQYTLEK